LLIMIFFSINNVAEKLNVSRLLMMLTVLPLLIYLILSKSVQIGSQNQLLAYGQLFLSFGIERVAKSISEAAYFGQGLALIGANGYMTTTVEIVSFDSWVFSAIPQVGLIGFLSMIVSWIFWILRSVIGKSQDNDTFKKSTIVGIILAGSLAYAHQAAFMTRLMIPLLMIALAFLAYDYSSKRKASVGVG